MISITIKPDREYLHEVIDKLRSNRYTIPAFQRNFVWKTSQVLDLFDSVARLYPIGSLLLWKPTNETPLIPSKHILSGQNTSDIKAEYFILDGRQRLTSLYGVLMYDLIPAGTNEKDVFNIGYNLEKDCFEHIRKDGVKPKATVHVSEIYDTFKLLTVLQDIGSWNMPKEMIDSCMQRAKSLNAKLQQYQIGEMLLDNCDLDEASTVFGRINSKGTDISKVSMLQAMFYQESNKILLSDKIDSIINSMGEYGFDKLKQDDVLNCCYQYVGRNFFDSNLFVNPAKIDFTGHLEEIKGDLTRLARFLHNDCGVIDSSMIPYMKQMTMMSYFFFKHKSINEIQVAELRKWFFYTSIKQSFQNSSLSVVRELFTRFKAFVSGDSESAIDYEPLKFEELYFPRKFSRGSALSNLLIICLGLHVKKYYPAEHQLDFLGYYKTLGMDSVGILPYLSAEDRTAIPNIMERGISDGYNLEIYGLDDDMLRAYISGDTTEYRENRERKLKQIESEILSEFGIEFTDLDTEGVG